MAKIYISYRHTDKDLTFKIVEELRKRGHEIVMDSTVMKVGQDWRKTLLEALKTADGVLVLITEYSLESKHVISEIGTARAFVGENSDRKFLIPVIYGNIAIPNFIEDLYCIRLQDEDFEATIDKIDESISAFVGRSEAVKENETQERLQIELNAADYISIAKTELGTRERHNKMVAYLCYIIGFITLGVGLYFAIDGLKSISDLQKVLETHPNQVIGIYIMAVIKSLLIIGLLIASSKYTFTLGKSFMHEALRNADRIHAISFGEFYLKAFNTESTSPTDIKEIFQHWNIDKSSSFMNLDAASYDPKFSESLLDIIKTLSGKAKEEK